MLENTPMPYPEHSNDALLCQQDRPINARMGAQKVLAAVARAYNDVYPAADVTLAAILGPSRAADVARARHLCAYLLMEDAHLTCVATAKVLGGRDHSTILHSRARIAAALDQDAALRQLLRRARGRLDDRPEVQSPERDQSRGQVFAAATPRELAEYRYWRLRALRSSWIGTVR